MGIIVELIVGGLVGWMASMLMKTDQQMGVLVNIIIGVVGALLGSWLFGSVLGFGSAFTSGNFSLVGFFWAILGSVVLIGILKLLKVLR